MNKSHSPWYKISFNIKQRIETTSLVNSNLYSTYVLLVYLSYLSQTVWLVSHIPALIHFLQHRWKRSMTDTTKLEKGYTHMPTYSLIAFLFFWSYCLLRDLLVLSSLYIHASGFGDLTVLHVLKPGCKAFWRAASSSSKARINKLTLMK